LAEGNFMAEIVLQSTQGPETESELGFRGAA
jgi:hypothetical protein